MTLSNLGVTVGSDDKIAIDRIGTTGYPISKMVLGREGMDAGFVDRDNPVPIIDDLSYARGIVSGIQLINKFGKNTNLSTTADEAIWSPSTAYSFPSAALAVRVRAGGNAADAAAGAGMRTITVEGLDSNFREYSEILTLAGASASAASTGTFIRVHRAYGETVGVYNATNSGNILIEHTDGKLLAQIDSRRGQTQMAIYTVPSGKTALFNHLSVYVDSNKEASIRLMKRENANQTTPPLSPFRVIQEFSNIKGSVASDATFRTVPEMTDIIFIARATNPNTACHANIDIVLVGNGN